MDIENWLAKIDHATGEVKRSFGELTAEQLNWKPVEKTWSIAQNLDHLIIINESYYPIIRAVNDGKYITPWTGKIGFLVNFMGDTLLKAVQPDRKKKMKTLPLWEPSKSEIKPDIVNRFENHQTDLKEMIRSCSHLIHKGIVISSPANKFLVYKLDTAFDIMVAHEQRHLNHAKRIMEMQQV